MATLHEHPCPAYLEIFISHISGNDTSAEAGERPGEARPLHAAGSKVGHGLEQSEMASPAVSDFTDRCIGSNSLDNRRHHVFSVDTGLFDIDQGRSYSGVVSFLSKFRGSSVLGLRGARIYAKRAVRRIGGLWQFVNRDPGSDSIVDLLLTALRTAIQDFVAETAVDDPQRAAGFLYRLKVFPDLVSDCFRQRFNEIGSSKRVNGIGEAMFVGYYLLRPYCDLDRILGRRADSFVV